MPNSPVPANPARLPALTRRALLARTASIAAGTLVPSAALPTQVDAELTALWARFEQAIAAHAAAQEHFNACEERYCAQCPAVPRELTQAGPLGHLIRDWDYWQARGLRRLVRGSECQRETEAVAALLPVALAHERRERRLRHKLGLAAAERAYRAADDAVDKVCRAILCVPARSAAGFAVKARAVKHWYGREWWSADEGHAELSERLAAQVLDWVMAMNNHGDQARRA